MSNTLPHFFAPRIGFAWSPRNNWSVRGGFGIYNIIAGQNTTAPASAWGQGWVPVGNMWCPDSPLFQFGNRTANWQDPEGGQSNCYDSSFGIGPPLPIYPTNQNRTADIFNGLSVNYSPWNVPMEYSAEYQFDIQHQFAHGVVLDLGYVGNRGVNLQYGRDINQICIRQQDCSRLGIQTGERPYPNFGAIGGSLFDGRSNYNAMQIIAKKQFARGLSFAVNYAWAKALDTQTSSGWGGAGAAERGGAYQNAYDPNSNYAPASNDIRHTFNGSVVYDLPFGKGRPFLGNGGIVDAIVGGWELASIFHLRSGLPFSVVMGYDGAGTGSGGWRPDLAAPGTACDPTGQTNKCLGGKVFVTPQLGTFGNVGRNNLYGPNWKTFDLSMMKNFPLRVLGERGSLQLKATATDVFNHPNLSFPDATYDDSGFGTTTSANTSRQMQLGAKISF